MGIIACLPCEILVVSFKPSNIVVGMSDYMDSQLFMLILSLYKVLIGYCFSFICLASSPVVHILDSLFFVTVFFNCFLMFTKYSELSNRLKLVSREVKLTFLCRNVVLEYWHRLKWTNVLGCLLSLRFYFFSCVYKWWEIFTFGLCY